MISDILVGNCRADFKKWCAQQKIDYVFIMNEMLRTDFFGILSVFFKYRVKTLNDANNRVRVYNSMSNKEMEIFWKY